MEGVLLYCKKKDGNHALPGLGKRMDARIPRIYSLSKPSLQPCEQVHCGEATEVWLEKTNI